MRPTDDQFTPRMSGLELKEYRRQIGLTQRDFARWLHVHEKTVRCMEAGLRRVTELVEWRVRDDLAERRNEYGVKDFFVLNEAEE